MPKVIELGSGQTLLVPDVAIKHTPSSDLARPVDVVSLAVVEGVQRGVERASAMKVVSAEDMAVAAELLNNLQKFESSIKAKALEAGRPFRDEADRIRDMAKQVLDPLAEAKTRVSAEMSAYRAIEQEQIAKAKEAARIAQEQAAAEQAHRQREQERLRKEAEARETVAVEALDNAKDEQAFNEAGKAFDRSLEVQAQAEAVVPVAAPVAVIIPTETKVKGVKVKKTPVIISFDLEKLPLTYHELDETKVKKHILDGTITAKTPGIVFSIDESYGGSGR